jgi:pimeloyl-ACP methyl ester carboxylesterase
MNTLPLCLEAAAVVMILVSLGVGGVPTKSDRVSAAPPQDDRLGQQSDGLEMRRPFERGKIPVVFIHGLWGNTCLWGRMVEELEADPALRRRYQFWMFRYASADFRPGEEPPDAIQVHTGKEWVRRTHEAQDERGRASVVPPLSWPNNLLAADRPYRGCEEWEVESP